MKVNVLVETVNLGAKSGIHNSAARLADAVREKGIETDFGGKGYGYDIIHTHTPSPDFLRYAKRAKEHGCKIIMHAHTTKEDMEGSFTFTDAPMVRRLAGKYLAFFYNHADLVITPSEWSKKMLINSGVKRPIEVLSNGVNLEKFRFSERARSEFRKEYGLSESDFLAYCVGLVFIRKGIADFKRTARLLPEQKFFWIGKKMALPIVKPVRLSLALSRIPSNMHMLGYVKDIVAANCGGDAFFFPSFVENQGMVLLEAGACRRALVVRDIPVYEGWLEDGKNCLKANDAKGFAEALRSVAEDEKLRKRLSDGAYKTAVSNDIRKSADKLARIYRGM